MGTMYLDSEGGMDFRWAHGASGPITSWQIEEEKVEAVTDFLSMGSKITADGDCCQSLPEIKRHLLLGRKAMTNLDSVLKSKDGVCCPGTLLQTGGAVLRWWRNRMGRPLSPQKIHQKNI